MKQLLKPEAFKYYFFLFIVFLNNLVVLAQDSTTSSVSTTATSTTETNTWYTETWVWVAGAMVGILLIIALIRSSGNSGRTDKVTVTKTTSTDV